MWLLVNHIKPLNNSLPEKFPDTEFYMVRIWTLFTRRFALKLIFFNGRQLQNNSINGAMSITTNRVIRKKNLCTIALLVRSCR